MSFDLHKYYKLKVDKQVYIDGGKLGLKNNSSNCYINSIIQCLVNTYPLIDYIFSNNINNHDNKSRAYTSFITVVYKLFHEKFNQDTSGLIRVLGKDNGVQYDSCETLFELLECIHYSIKYKVEFNIQGTEIVKSDKLMIKGFESWINHFKDGYSFIIENFYGNFITEHTKCKCSESFEPFSLLMLPPFETLEKSIEEYTKSEPCHCNSKRGTKKVSFWNLPDTLIINFKRYTSTGEKINSKVDFPFELDLKKFVSPLKCDNNKYMYSLYAVNYHIGTMQSGHYWSCCKDITDTWYKYDDDNVERINDRTHVIRDSAYILFYQRTRILV